MKITLFDFQKDALHQLRDKLVAARKFASTDNPQAIAFSAPTGSGKTIIMTALFEAILDQPDDELAWPMDWLPQPDAVILWVSDMPELNEQTRLKIESTSDKIYRINQLITIDTHFDAPQFQGGRVYFINTQKLAVNQPLTNRGDERQYLIWETLTNTARACPDRFYVVIDEAHRGMLSARGAQTAQTIMQRFLLGYSEVGLVRMPLVIGVSATPRRFLDLLEQAPHTVHKVTISAEEVRKSGLLKDRILIHYPESATTVEMGLLEEAARRWNQMTLAWDRYCNNEQEPTVRPVLVVQVENGTDHQLTRTDLDTALNVIEGAIGRRLNEGEVVHAMHDAGDLDVGGRRVHKVDASRIDADNNIGVVFFKMSLSTGWDCPRAEVMLSFRHAEDHTYIAQLLGRMVRAPLARRIEKDAALNDVHLFLPHFDQNAVQSVVNALENQEEVPPAEIGSSHELMTLKRREGTESLFAALEKQELVTYRLNAVRAQNSLRRYLTLVYNLTRDKIDEDAWSQAKQLIVQWMAERVAAIKAAGQFDEAARTITQVGLQSLAVYNGTGVSKLEAAYRIEASSVDIDRLFEETGRVFSHGLQKEYWLANAGRDAVDVKVETIVLARNAGQMAELENLAEYAFNVLYDQHKGEIHRLAEHRRMNYERLRLATSKPVEVPWRLPLSIDFNRPPSAPLWDRHLYVEDNGQFRAELGSWEAGVLNEELADPTVVGWLRNLDRKAWSLEIPYTSGGSVKSMFPDLIIVRQEKSGYTIDILEPHRQDLGDNVEKAVGLARFAEKHGALFGRIQLIRKQSTAHGEHYVRLEINQLATIRRLLLINNNPQLDAIFDELGR